MLVPAVERIRRRAGKPPRAVTADRGDAKPPSNKTSSRSACAPSCCPRKANQAPLDALTSDDDRSNAS
jgi:hypothetical protein